MTVFPLKSPPDASGNFEIEQIDLRHLVKSLRIKAGDSFQVLLPDGRRGLARLRKEGRNYLASLEKILQKEIPKQLPLWIGIGVVRWPRLEWLMEKATELGVFRISPLILSRTRIPKADQASLHKWKRLEKIGEASLKQCGRPAPTQLDKPQDLNSWLKTLPHRSVQKILCNEKISDPRLHSAFLKKNKLYIVLLGPEGGFDPEEVFLLEQNAFQSVSLGSTSLRSETAALYVTAALDFFLAGLK